MFTATTLSAAVPAAVLYVTPETFRFLPRTVLKDTRDASTDICSNCKLRLQSQAKGVGLRFVHSTASV